MSDDGSADPEAFDRILDEMKKQNGENADGTPKSESASQSDGEAEPREGEGEGEEGEPQEGESESSESSDAESSEGETSSEPGEPEGRSDAEGDPDSEKATDAEADGDAETGDSSGTGDEGEEGEMGSEGDNSESGEEGEGSESEGAGDSESGDKQGQGEEGQPGDSESDGEDQEPTENQTEGGAAQGEGTGSATGEGAGNDNEGDVDDLERGGDDANLEYTRKATDLVLEYLKDQENKSNRKLLDRLGWTPQQMRRFTNRWEKLHRRAKQAGKSGAEGRAELNDALRSLGLHPGRDRIRRGSAKNDRGGKVGDQGTRSLPPDEYLEQYRAYLEGKGLREGR